MAEEEIPIKEFNINQPTEEDSKDEDDTTLNDLIKRVAKDNQEPRMNVTAKNENVGEEKQLNWMNQKSMSTE